MLKKMFKLVQNLSSLTTKNRIVSTSNHLTCFYSSRVSKKHEDAIKKKVQYYIENELPDKKLETELANLKNELKTQV
jgi:hypothetical protein